MAKSEYQEDFEKAIKTLEKIRIQKWHSIKIQFPEKGLEQFRKGCYYQLKEIKKRTENCLNLDEAQQIYSLLKKLPFGLNPDAKPE